MTFGLDQVFEAHLAALVSGSREQPCEGRISGADGAFPIERGDGNWSRVEQPGKSELGGSSFVALAGPAFDDEGVRQSSAQPVQDPNGKAGAIAFDEVDLEAPRSRLRLAAAGVRD